MMNEINASSSMAKSSPWALCVAPMMDWTDRHCRFFHRLLAPNARLYTEMVHANAVLQGDRRRLLGHAPMEHPLALQLGGSDPKVLAEACRVAEQAGFGEVNLNVGCPSDRVQSGRFGACLMREPLLVAECVHSMCEAVSVPITVKCRIGVDDQQPREALFALVDASRAAGCSVFVVHARKAWLEGLSPKENREIPPLDYPLVRDLKRSLPELVVVLNGGLADIAQVENERSHVDGVMIGRAAYHTPYFLHELDRTLFGGKMRGRAELLQDFREYFDSQRREGVPASCMLRHVLGLFHGERGGRLFRRVLSERMHRRDVDWSLVEQALDATRSGAIAA